MNGSLKQSFPHGAEGILPPRNQLHLNRDIQPLRCTVNFGSRLPRLFKGQLAGADDVTVEAHRDTGAELNQVLQNFQVLAGVVRETVDIKHMGLGIVAFLQLLQQPGHLIAGITLSLAAQSIIALHEQGQLL